MVKRVVCIFFLALGVSGPTQSAGAENPTPIDDSLKQRETLDRILDIGTAAFAWLTDEVGDDPNLESGRSIASEEAATIDWAQCPGISHADLVALLVPSRIREVPALDGWGNPLQFCLNRPNLTKRSYVVGIRSAGRDGQWGPTAFKRGAFDPTDFDHDMVWLDGYFVAWPRGKEPKPRSLPPNFGTAPGSLGRAVRRRR